MDTFLLGFVFRHVLDFAFLNQQSAIGIISVISMIKEIKKENIFACYYIEGKTEMYLYIIAFSTFDISHHCTYSIHHLRYITPLHI